jgi:predicted RNA-binding protein
MLPTAGRYLLYKRKSLMQKGVCYVSVKTFNSLRKFSVDLVGDEKQFTGKLKEILIHNSFYSVDEFYITYTY